MKRDLAPGTLALAVAESSNSKIGDAATTYAAQQSCPTDCVFFNGGGCYAEEGPLGKFVTGPLNRAADASLHRPTLEAVALAEAEAIDEMQISMGRPLRLHTVGDCATDQAASIVAAAAERYRERGGGPVWTYTHAWSRVHRESWGHVSVLASCETGEDVVLAHSRGYATAIVVEEFASQRRHEIAARPAVNHTASPNATGYGLTVGEGRPRYPASTWRRGESPQDRPAASRAEPGSDPVGPEEDHVPRAAQPPVSLLPCPSQTRGVPCSDCRLCFNDERLLRERLTIGFALHGVPVTMRRARMALNDPTNPDRKLSSRVLIPRFVAAYVAEHGKEPTNRVIAEALDMNESSVWEMRKSIRTGKPARDARRGRRRR